MFFLHRSLLKKYRRKQNKETERCKLNSLSLYNNICPCHKLRYCRTQDVYGSGSSLSNMWLKSRKDNRPLTSLETRSDSPELHSIQILPTRGGIYIPASLWMKSWGVLYYDSQCSEDGGTHFYPKMPPALITLQKRYTKLLLFGSLHIINVLLRKMFPSISQTGCFISCFHLTDCKQLTAGFFTFLFTCTDCWFNPRVSLWRIH